MEGVEAVSLLAPTAASMAAANSLSLVETLAAPAEDVTDTPMSDATPRSFLQPPANWEEIMRENAALKNQLQDIQIPRLSEQRVRVTSVPNLDWSALPRLNFAYPETVLHWVAEFESLMEINNVEEDQALVHLRTLPRSADGSKLLASAGWVPGDYKASRDALIRTRGHPDPLKALPLEMVLLLPHVKSAAQWVGISSRFATYTKLAAHAWGVEYNAEARHGECLAFIMGFPAALRGKLTRKFKERLGAENLLEDLHLMAPRWDATSNLEVASTEGFAAAGVIYRDTNRLRPAKQPLNAGSQRLRGVRKPGTPGLVRAIKKVDSPAKQAPRDAKEGPCKNCGAPSKCPRSTCAARGKICAKCGRRNHMSAVCRSSSALAV